jgi:hypothetical protein
MANVNRDWESHLRKTGADGDAWGIMLDGWIVFQDFE